MAETVNIPGFGSTSKKTAYLLGGGLVLIVGVAWYRSKNAAAAPAAAAPSDGGSTVDPATGFPYGSAEDAAALASQAGYISPSGGGGGGGGGASTAGSYTTNGQWAQAAEDYIVNTVNGGSHADLVGNALGKYITGVAITADQVNIVQQAIAFTGYPPVNGPSGYPPSYRTTPSTPAPAKVTGLKVTSTTKTTVGIQWDRVSGADYYHVHSTGTGSHDVRGGSVQFHDSKLHSNRAYKYYVYAVKSGKSGPASLTVTAHTHK